MSALAETNNDQFKTMVIHSNWNYNLLRARRSKDPNSDVVATVLDQRFKFLINVTQSSQDYWKLAVGSKATFISQIATGLQNDYNEHTEGFITKVYQGQNTLSEDIAVTPSTPLTSVNETKASSKSEDNNVEKDKVYDEARHVLIVDRSGSMRSFGNETHGALRAYLEGVNETHASSKVTLITFDDQIEVVAKNAAPSLAIQPAWIEPRGMTALRDALVKGIEIADKEEIACGITKTTVEINIAVFTDGSDNASSISPSGLAQMIAQRESRGNWDFTFLAANQNAITSAAAIGISRKNAISVGKAKGGMRCAMQSASKKCKRSGFSSAQRSKAMKGC